MDRIKKEKLDNARREAWLKKQAADEKKKELLEDKKRQLDEEKAKAAESAENMEVMR